MDRNHQIKQQYTRWHDLAYWGLLLAVCIVFYVFNLWTSFKEDDMEFSLLRNAGFVDFWRARWEQYLTSNGRCADFYATLFCAYLGKPLFNICNTLVFGLMAHLLVLLSTGRRSILALALFIAVVAVCFPAPGQTMLFVAGSCNYMWAIIASLSLIYLLKRYRGVKLGWGKTALLLLLALVAGNFNEATSLGVLGGAILYFILNPRELDRRTLMVMAAYLLGVLAIFASPGTLSRILGGGIAVNMSLGELLKSRCYIFFKMMVLFGVPIAALLVGIVAWTRCGWQTVKHSLWACIMVAMAGLMLALGYLFERAYAPITTVAFIIVAMGIDRFLSGWQWERSARLLLTAIALVISAIALYRAGALLHELKAFEDNIEREITAAPRHAVLHEYRFEKKGRFITPLRYVSTDFFNREATYCAYYDKDNVQFVDDSIYDRYHTGSLLDGAIPMPMVSDRPEIADSVLAIPNINYMVILLKDTLLPTPQLATYYLAEPGAGLSEQEKQYRSRHGMADNFEPHGFFPLYYQGRQMLVCPFMNRNISHAEFQLDYDGTLGTMTLTREAD